jgi:hypothetical protein
MGAGAVPPPEDPGRQSRCPLRLPLAGVRKPPDAAKSAKRIRRISRAKSEDKNDRVHRRILNEIGKIRRIHREYDFELERSGGCERPAAEC